MSQVVTIITGEGQALRVGLVETPAGPVVDIRRATALTKISGAMCPTKWGLAVPVSQVASLISALRTAVGQLGPGDHGAAK